MNLEIVPSELVIVVLACLCTGAFLKSTNKIPDTAIPMIILVESIIFTVSFNKAFTVENVMLGIICAAMAVFGKNIQKQIKESKKDK